MVVVGGGGGEGRGYRDSCCSFSSTLAPLSPGGESCLVSASGCRSTMPRLARVSYRLGVLGVGVREERGGRWSSRPQVGGGAEAQAELCLELPPLGLEVEGGLPPLAPDPGEGGVEGGGLRPVGVEAGVHDVGVRGAASPRASHPGGALSDSAGLVLSL